MAIKDLNKRLAKMEQRFIVQPRHVVPDSHAALTKDLTVSRMVLKAEREAHEWLSRLEQAGEIRSTESPAQSAARREAAIREREHEVADLARRCAEAGLTEDDISRYAP